MKRLMFVVVVFVLLCHLGSVGANSSTLDSSGDEYYGYCTAYCDYYDSYHSEQDCGDHEFCCGAEYERWCCYDDDLRLDRYYDSVDECKGNWWTYQWRIIIGLLVTLIALLVLAACCYYCCGDPQSPRRVWRRERAARRNNNNNTEVNTVSSNTGESTLNEPPALPFDPESPYAFIPPAYESLPKDPPKYSDIYDNINEAFVGDSEASGSGVQQISNPAYGVEADLTTPLPNREPMTVHSAAAGASPQTPHSPTSPPPPYTNEEMPEVSIDDQRPVTTTTFGNTSPDSSTANEAESDGSVSATSITVVSNSNSDAESEDSVSMNNGAHHAAATRSNVSDDSSAVCNPLYDRNSGSHL